VTSSLTFGVAGTISQFTATTSFGHFMNDPGRRDGVDEGTLTAGFAHHLSKNADISSDRGAIPSLVLELLLAFLYAKLSTFPNANHNIGIVSAELSLKVYQASDVVTHDFSAQCVHL